MNSTGEGEFGAKDMTGSWNNGGQFEKVDNPAFNPERMKLGGKTAHGGRK